MGLILCQWPRLYKGGAFEQERGKKQTGQFNIQQNISYHHIICLVISNAAFKYQCTNRSSIFTNTNLILIYILSRAVPLYFTAPRYLGLQWDGPVSTLSQGSAVRSYQAVSYSSPWLKILTSKVALRSMFTQPSPFLAPCPPFPRVSLATPDRDNPRLRHPYCTISPVRRWKVCYRLEWPQIYIRWLLHTPCD